MKGPLSRILALLFVLLTAGLLYFVTATSRQLSHLEGISAVHCDKAGEQILVAGWGQVRILDSQGKSLDYLRDQEGNPAAVTGVSSIAVGDDGRIWIVEPPLHRVSRFTADGTFIDIATEGPEVVFRSASVLPLPSGRFVVADTVARRLRLHREFGGILRELKVSIPNGLLALDDGFAVVVTGDARVRAFDGDLKSRPVAKELQLPRLDSSVYEIDVDDPGHFYYHVCPLDTRCTIRRRSADAGANGQATEEIVAADHWLAGYDEQDPSYNFCSTSDGRILIASQTMDSPIEYSGALAPGQEPPKDLEWEQIRSGHEAVGIHIRAFGDESFLKWIEEGRRRKEALADQVRLGRAAMGGLLTLLLVAYLFDRLLGRHLRVNTTLRRVGSVLTRVLWPDRLAIARWAAPAIALGGAGLLAGVGLSRLDIAGPVEGFALAIGTTFLVKNLLSGERLASQRSARTAHEAFNLYLGPGAPVPWFRYGALGTLEAETASFAAEARLPTTWSDRLSDALQETGRVADDAFEPAELLEGPIHLVAFGGGHLVWYPCQLGGKPRGPIHRASCTPAPTPAHMPGSSLRVPGGRLTGVHPELVHRLSAVPEIGPVETRCEECGRQITENLDQRCPHYRDRQRAALAASALLPGLGHLVQRQFQRGRWLTLASGLLMSRLIYLGLPVLMETLPWRPSKFVVPLLLYGLLWWIALMEVRRTPR